MGPPCAGQARYRQQWEGRSLQVYVRRLHSIAEDTRWQELLSVHCCEEAPPCDLYVFKGGSVVEYTLKQLADP